MDFSKKSKGAVATLPDDSLLEILSRVPAKSLCRFKCVSKAWRDLIADPHYRKKLPQAMQGFFFVEGDMVRHSASLSFIDLAARSVPLDIDPSFSFVTGIQKLQLLGSCNGLVLFGHHPEQRALGYIVCNPTTKRWAAVPACGSLDLETSAYLAFDQAVSSHFHLVQFQMSIAEEMLVSLHAYSSETGTWSHNQIVSQEKQGPMVGWHHHVKLSHMNRQCAFVNGFLHFIVGDLDQLQIVCVDVEGKPRKMITAPHMPDEGHQFCYLAQSQGCMHYMTQEMEMLDAYDESGKLSIWVLQDYDTQEWVLKHTVSNVEISEELAAHIMDYEVIGIHQDCNVVFLLQSISCKLIAYDMDRKEVNVIATFEDQKMPFGFAGYVPYVAESPALTN